MTVLPAHSPLGGSGTHRWMKCAGSVAMVRGHADGDSDHAALGTAAHALGASCLVSGQDAWEHIGKYVAPDESFVALDDEKPADMSALNGGGYFLIDKDMADAVQVYLDAVREAHPDRNQGNFFVEQRFHCPEVHELMYGQSDATYADLTLRHLHTWDYKHGVGVVVEAPHNPQLMYYAVGMLTVLDLWSKCDYVTLHVAQPRGFHYEGPIREFTISVEELETWRDLILIPSMNMAQSVIEGVTSGKLTFEDLLEQGYLTSGEHCRFCPARFGNCPRHEMDMRRMEELMAQIEEKGGAPHATLAEIGEFLDLFEVAKIRQKAWREAAHEKAEAGAVIPGWKLVTARANRVWKEKARVGKKMVEVAALAREKFGADAFEPEKLKSAAQLEKLPNGRDFAAEYAYKPPAGTQLVPASESRQEVSPRKKSMFKPVAKKRSGKK